MALDQINLGSAPNDGTGDDLRAAGGKINAAIGYLSLVELFFVNLKNAGLSGSYNVADNPLVIGVDLTGNSFTSIDVRRAVSLKHIDITGMTSLTSFNAFANPPVALFSLDVSTNANLESLLVTSHNLSTIDVSSNVALTTLYLDETPLETVDISENVNLIELGIIGCTSISSVDVSQNVALTALRLTSTPISSVDISQNVNLQVLAVNDTSLSTLDISSNPAINYLRAEGCGFSEAVVDALLAALDAAGVTGGSADLSGSNQAPSGAGLSSKSSLEGKGWSISVS